MVDVTKTGKGRMGQILGTGTTQGGGFRPGARLLKAQKPQSNLELLRTGKDAKLYFNKRTEEFVVVGKHGGAQLGSGKTRTDALKDAFRKHKVNM